MRPSPKVSPMVEKSTAEKTRSRLCVICLAVCSTVLTLTHVSCCRLQATAADVSSRRNVATLQKHTRYDVIRYDTIRYPALRGKVDVKHGEHTLLPNLLRFWLAPTTANRSAAKKFLTSVFIYLRERRKPHGRAALVRSTLQQVELVDVGCCYCCTSERESGGWEQRVRGDDSDFWGLYERYWRAGGYKVAGAMRRRGEWGRQGPV